MADLFLDMKKFKKNGVEYPYVSGQAMRFYLKEAIRRNLTVKDYMCIPNDKGETCGDVQNLTSQFLRQIP